MFMGHCLSFWRHGCTLLPPLSWRQLREQESQRGEGSTALLST